MKKLLIIHVLCFLTACKAQQTVYDLQTPYYDVVAGNRYIKDINNIRDRIVGTWSAVHNGNTFEITLSKLDNYSPGSPGSTMTEDIVIGTYTYTDATGNILASYNGSAYGNNLYKLALFYESYFLPADHYSIIIKDVVSTVGMRGEFILTSPTTASWELRVIPGVKLGGVPSDQFSLPRSLVLTKQ